MPVLLKNIVLDTNLIVSAVINPAGVASQTLDIAEANFDIVASKETLAELVEVLSREKFDRYASKDERKLFAMDYADTVKLISVQTVVTECEDPKDNKFLSLAVDARAVLVVSGDKKHLMGMTQYKGIPILGLREFISSYEAFK
jgi:uncharacterized protein